MFMKKFKHNLFTILLEETKLVAWIHTNRYTLLTLQNRVITRSSRFKVSHNSHRTWWLHITNVQERDRGEYMCQINTVKMMKQFGYLEVVGKSIQESLATKAAYVCIFSNAPFQHFTAYLPKTPSGAGKKKKTE
ncbi:ig domain-containing protein [Caerostris darwini]|uniref:Ig domain-containing protein n=1 Tax=Caerostris darwini TaxID=1538125 RepID=A0AAV4U1V7_9ARAC|nr:ig domain-containing protein [Caerostris darwini]